MKPKLHLKDLASVAIQPPPVKEPPAPKAAEPAPAAEAIGTLLPSPKPSKGFARSAPTPAHAEAREFSFPHGLPITISRDAVVFYAALKDVPETAMLIALKGT